MSTPEPELVEISAYFLLDEGGGDGGTLMPVRRIVSGGTRQVVAAALDELLAGPTEAEIAMDPADQPPFSLIPSNTLSLGISGPTDGIVTVDLSREFEAGAGSSVFVRRLAQVVYTLTQFRTISGVDLKLDGQPKTAFDASGKAIDGPAKREHYLDLLPSIFVDQPAWGATVTRPIVVSGKANVFEAVFQIELSDDQGRVIIRRPVAATCGSGCWGDWRHEFDVEAVVTERLWITVWSPSAVDGRPENLRRYPITLPPRP